MLHSQTSDDVDVGDVVDGEKFFKTVAVPQGGSLLTAATAVVVVFKQPLELVETMVGAVETVDSHAVKASQLHFVNTSPHEAWNPAEATWSGSVGGADRGFPGYEVVQNSPKNGVFCRHWNSGELFRQVSVFQLHIKST